jgi:outer membrane lipoprotein-sorting protein
LTSRIRRSQLAVPAAILLAGCATRSAPAARDVLEPGQDVRKAESLARGEQILQRAQQAMGGAEKLAAVKDVIHAMKVALEPAAGGFEIKQVSLYVAPGQIRQEQDTPFGKVTVYSDGKSGWFATAKGVQPMPADILKQAQGVVFRQPSRLILSDRDPSRSVKAVRGDAVEISTADGQSVLIEFDSVTGLPARQIYTEASASGPVERAEIFSDWRDVDGIKMPYKAVQQENGTKRLEVTVSEYRINSGISAEQLSKRP